MCQTQGSDSYGFFNFLRRLQLKMFYFKYETVQVPEPISAQKSPSAPCFMQKSPLGSCASFSSINCAVVLQKSLTSTLPHLFKTELTAFFQPEYFSFLIFSSMQGLYDVRCSFVKISSPHRPRRYPAA